MKAPSAFTPDSNLGLGDRIRFASPASRLIRLDLAQAFEILALHSPRHLDQAQRVRVSAGFPARM